MNINGHPFRYDNGVAILGLNSAGQPWITWATGPNGTRIPRSVDQENTRSPLVVEPAALETASALNSLEDPIANATGLRMDQLHGTIDSTQVFALLRDAL